MVSKLFVDETENEINGAARVECNVSYVETWNMKLYLKLITLWCLLFLLIGVKYMHGVPEIMFWYCWNFELGFFVLSFSIFWMAFLSFLGEYKNPLITSGS